MVHWYSYYAGFAILPAVQVPDQPMVLGGFAPGDLPRGTSALGVDQVVSGGPADDEPQLVFAQFLEPGGAGVDPVEDVDQPFTRTQVEIRG